MTERIKADEPHFTMPGYEVDALEDGTVIFMARYFASAEDAKADKLTNMRFVVPADTAIVLSGSFARAGKVAKEHRLALLAKQ